MDDLQFWEEDCLNGPIDHNPLPPPPRSFFESELFCNEEINEDIDSRVLESQPSEFLFPVHDTAVEPFSTVPNLSPELISPSIPAAIPLALSPVRSLPESPQQRPLGWRSFLDENCPLRRRVKVTITPSTRVKRPMLACASPQSSKKRRFSAHQSHASLQNGSRYTQTKLCLPSAGTGTTRITLHVPFDTSRNNSSSAPLSLCNKPLTKQTNPIASTNNRQLTDIPEIPTNLNNQFSSTLTNLDKLIDHATEVQLPPITLESSSDLDENDFLENLATGDITTAPNIDIWEGELGLEELDTASHLTDAEGGRRLNPPPVLPQPHAEPAYLRRRIKPRSCISADLMCRIGAIKNAATGVEKEKNRAGSALPLVDVAVQAVTRTAQKYAMFINTVGNFPPAASVAGVLRMPQSGGRGRRGWTGGSYTASGRPKKVRRKRTLLRFDDKEVAPLGEDDAEVNGTVEMEARDHRESREESPLARLLNTPLASQI